MASLYGVLGLQDTDYSFINTFGQQVIYDATLQILGDHNADLEAAEAIFVEDSTYMHKMRYKLPGSGMLQRVSEKDRPAQVKASGSWDVAFPLEEFAGEIAGDRVALAYMTLDQYDVHLQTIQRKDANTRRFEILKALFNNTGRTFVDDFWGSLTVQPLANGDSVTYPPVVGAYNDSTQQNYLAAGYTAITDTNNPIPTIVNTLESRLGTPTGGSNIVIFCNNQETTAIQGLANFDPVPNRFVEYGDIASLVPPDKFPEGLPGRILGESDAALIVEWRFIPAGYLLGIHLDAAAPLMRRIDPPSTGLPNGLALVAQDIEYPFRTATWSHRFGYGVGNRLNGVVMQLTAGSYTIPTQYQ